MLRALCAGETDGAKLAMLTRGQLKKKQSELGRALSGKLSPAQRFVLRELLDQYEELEAALSRASAQVKQEVAKCADPFVLEAVELLQTIPGVGQRVAEVIVSEIGVSMRGFPSDGHLASWAGMCPGSNESAGKRRSGRTTKGGIYLRNALVQAAWAATHTKETYLAAQYTRLVKRKGKNRALVAVGHSILVIIYHVLSRKESYSELGGDYFDKHNVEVQRNRLVRQLERLGMKVTLEALPVAA
jgi:transposase